MTTFKVNFKGQIHKSKKISYNNKFIRLKQHSDYVVEVKRKGDLLSKEEKKKATEEIITFFKNQRDENIGIIAAGEILDFFLENRGLKMYNKGVEDSIAFLKNKLEDLELDMELLLRK